MELEKILSAHFIDVKTEEMVAKMLLYFVPRVGDEIRIAGDRYYKVTDVVWCYDEPEAKFSRVNIGVIHHDASISSR